MIEKTFHEGIMSFVEKCFLHSYSNNTKMYNRAYFWVSLYYGSCNFGNLDSKNSNDSKGRLVPIEL